MQISDLSVMGEGRNCTSLLGMSAINEDKWVINAKPTSVIKNTYRLLSFHLIFRSKLYQQAAVISIVRRELLH